MFIISIKYFYSVIKHDCIANSQVFNRILSPQFTRESKFVIINEICTLVLETQMFTRHLFL